MKTIIKITKQEAIDAFREKHKIENNVGVEIEEEIGNLYTSSRYPSCISPVSSQTQCPICNELVDNVVHNCRGYKVTC